METGFDSILHHVRGAFLRLHRAARVPVYKEGTGHLPDKPGVYVLYERGRAMYVGRTGEKRTAGLQKRLDRHCSGAPNQAPLAKQLARKKVGQMGREELSKTEEFKAARTRVRAMSVQWVEERDPDFRFLLEFYAAKELRTPYNDFSET